MDWYVRSFAECSPWSYVLLAGQTMLLAMLLERAFFLLAKGMVRTDLLLGHIRKLVQSGSVDRAIKLTSAAPDMPACRVCKAGLGALGRGSFVLQEELDRAVAGELPRIQRRLPKIPLLGVALAVVGIAGSKLLGASSLASGGGGPLPLGLGMPWAPALVGVVTAAAALIGWLTLTSIARKMVAGLDECKRVLLELGAQPSAQPSAPPAAPPGDRPWTPL